MNNSWFFNIVHWGHLLPGEDRLVALCGLVVCHSHVTILSLTHQSLNKLNCSCSQVYFCFQFSTITSNLDQPKEIVLYSFVYFYSTSLLWSFLKVFGKTKILYMPCLLQTLTYCYHTPVTSFILLCYLADIVEPSCPNCYLVINTVIFDRPMPLCNSYFCYTLF